MKLEQIFYFAESYFIPGILWSEFEELYKEFMRNPHDIRIQFKDEVLAVQHLFKEEKFKEIEQLFEKSELSSTRVGNIRVLGRFIQTVLPLMNKYENNPEIRYEPLKAFRYMLEMYITPSTNLRYFNAVELKEEGDTYIQHLRNDIEYIEAIIAEGDPSKIIEGLSRESGVYILQSQDVAMFLLELKESVA